MDITENIKANAKASGFEFHVEGNKYYFKCTITKHIEHLGEWDSKRGALQFADVYAFETLPVVSKQLVYCRNAIKKGELSSDQIRKRLAIISDGEWMKGNDE